MNNKKRLLIVGIGLLITTTASTYAFFNQSITLNKNSSAGDFALQISNGNVNVVAAVGDGSVSPTWSYDVARLSTSLATYGLFGLTDTNSDGKINDLDTDYVTKYVDVNRSMDIVGVTGEGRKAIGAEVTGNISNARPGDALSVGQAGTANDGIAVTNSSSLTVKVKVEIDNTKEDEIKYLDQAGWLFYINDVQVNDGSGTLNLAAVQTALDAYTTVLEPGAVMPSKIKVRLELPLITGNSYQNKSVGTGGTASSFDVSTLFIITATQENNPGWAVDGN